TSASLTCLRPGGGKYSAEQRRGCLASYGPSCSIGHMRGIAVLSVILLAACTTYSERQAQEPLLEVVSAKAPAAFAGCIMPKAREHWAGYATLGPDGDAQVLTIAVDVNRVMGTLTIAPAGEGSRITYRAWIDSGKFRAFRADIAACA